MARHSYRAGVRRLIRLRAGVERLQIVRGTHIRSKEDRKCVVCLEKVRRE